LKRGNPNELSEQQTVPATGRGANYGREGGYVQDLVFTNLTSTISLATVTVNPVPIPSTISLLGLAGTTRKKQK